MSARVPPPPPSADGGTEPGVIYADIDPAEVISARTRIPNLQHDQPFDGP